MLYVLRLVEERLQNRVARAGFVRSGPADPDVDDARVGLLEYRRDVAGAPTLLLDIIAVAGSSRITSELWSPSDLARASATASVEDVALCRRTWAVDPADDPGTLVGEIADEVGAWLERIGRSWPDR